MKKNLVIGLGNALVPEDAAAVEFVRRIQPSEHVDVIEGGTDLLRHAGELRGRELIVLVDVVENSDVEIRVLEHGSPQLSDEQLHAHHLSAVQALDLIRWSDESVRNARCVWVLLGRASAYAPVSA